MTHQDALPVIEVAEFEIHHVEVAPGYEVAVIEGEAAELLAPVWFS